MDKINPRIGEIEINLKTNNPLPGQGMGLPTVKSVDFSGGVRPATSTSFTSTNFLDTHEKLWSGEYVSKFEDFDTSQTVEANAERLAKQQTKGDKWANGVTKFFGKVGTAVAGGTVGTINGVAELMNTGSLMSIYDNDFTKTLSDIDTTLTYNNPNYRSNEEADMNFLEAMGTANFWADDFLGGLSFTVGTVLSEGAWALATGGAGIATTATKLGTKAALKKSVKSLVKNPFKKIANATDDLVDTGINVSRANTFGAIGEMANTARFTMTSAGWESSFESINYLKEGMASFDSQFYQDNGREATYEERLEYMGRLRDGANTVFGGNMALVGTSNLAILGKIWGVKMPFKNSIGKSVNKRFFGIGLDKTGKELIKATRSQKIARNLNSFLKPMVTEGILEEGGQSTLSGALTNYAYAPFDPKLAGNSYDMVEAFADSFDETFTTKEGWKEVWTGMLIGLVGGKGADAISNKTLVGDVSRAIKDTEAQADFNKKYSFDSLSEAMFYANRVQDSNAKEGEGNSVVSAVNRKQAIIAQMNQAYNTGMFDDVVDDTKTAIKLMDNAEMAEKMGISEQEASDMKNEVLQEYENTARSYKKNRKFVDYYFGDKVKGYDETKTKLLKDTTAFILTNGEGAYTNSREIYHNITNKLATIFGDSHSKGFELADLIAHAETETKEQLDTLTKELEAVKEEYNKVEAEIADISIKQATNKKDVENLPQNIEEKTKKLTELENKKQELTDRLNRVVSTAKLENPYRTDDAGVGYFTEEDFANLDKTISEIEQAFSSIKESNNDAATLSELLVEYKNHLQAFSEFAKVSRDIQSGDLDLNSKKSIIGRIFNNKEYNSREKAFLDTISSRLQTDFNSYIDQLLKIKELKNETGDEALTSAVEDNRSALETLIANSEYLSSKFSEESLREAFENKQMLNEMADLMLKASGDKEFNGKYNQIDSNSVLTEQDKERLKYLMDIYGTLAVGEGFKNEGVTLIDILTQLTQSQVNTETQDSNVSEEEFGKMTEESVEELQGARNEEVTQTPLNVQMSKRGNTTIISGLTLKGLLGKLGVEVVDDVSGRRSNRGVSTAEVSQEKGTKIKFEVNGTVLTAQINNRGAIELDSESKVVKVQDVLKISGIDTVRYKNSSNKKYAFLYENGKPMQSDFSVTSRFNEDAVYDTTTGDYVRFEVDITDPYNQSLEGLSFEEKVKLVKIYIVNSKGDVVGELKSLDGTYGHPQFNILREEAAHVLENGGGFVGTEAQVKTVLLGTPNLTLNEEGNPIVVESSYENVVDWGVMVNGKLQLKNETDSKKIRRDFIRRLGKKSSVPVVIVRKGKHLVAMPVGLRGETTNIGTTHREALDNSNEDTAKKVIALNEDLLRRGQSTNLYFVSPTEQNIYDSEGNLTEEVLRMTEFLDNYQEMPDFASMSKERAMTYVKTPVNFDNNPIISPKVMLNFDKVSKIGERNEGVTAEIDATQESATQVDKTLENATETNQVQETSYKDTSFQDDVVLGHVKAGTPFYYQGYKGYLDTDGQRVIFISGNTEFDLGYAPEMTMQGMLELGLDMEEALTVSIDAENGTVVFDGVVYKEDKSLTTIIETPDGEYTVTLKAPNGTYVTFQGNKAEAIVYEYKKQEFTNKEITDEQGKEISKQTREARVTKRTRQTAPKAEDTDTKSSVVVTTSKKEAKKVVEEIKNPETTKASIGIAPALSNEIDSVTEVDKGLSKGNYGKRLDEKMQQIAKATGVKVTINNPSAGGWYSQDKGKTIKEPSKRIDVEYETQEQLDAFSNLLGALSPEVQEGVYVAQYTESGNDTEHAFVFDTNENAEIVINKLNDFGLGDGFSYDTKTKTLYIGDLGNNNLDKIKNLTIFAKNYGLNGYAGQKANISFPSIGSYATTLQRVRNTLQDNQSTRRQKNSLDSLIGQAEERITLYNTQPEAVEQPPEQVVDTVSAVVDRLTSNGLSSAVHMMTSEQVDSAIKEVQDRSIRAQLPLLNTEDLGEVIGSGDEAVVRRKGDKVYKTYSIDASSMYENEAEFVGSMGALNAEFPETGTRIVGKTIDGEYVVEQNYIDGVAPTKEVLDQSMRDKGFVYEEGTWKKNGMEFDDITPNNAYVTTDGTVVVYDANVYRGEDFDARYQIAGEQGARNLDQVSKAFNEGVEAVRELANEYKKEFGIDSVQHNKVDKLFPTVSRMIAEAYEQAETGMTTEEVKEAYKALEEETLQQYKFIVGKGLKVSRWTGEGEPYPNSKSMLKDVRENNHLYFLPNSEAFGKEGDEVEGRLGLKMTDVYLEDGYRMTLSEVFRVVHDYFGHGILGNQFGAIGEENATLQHLDLYSLEALPAVISQTRGQNSWVNFSGANNEALKKIREGSKTNNESLLKEGQKEFVFATPKDSILPKIFNFKYYETARRINEQEEIRKSETYLDPRGENEDTNISELLARHTSRNSGKLNGFSRRSLGVSKRLGGYDVDVIAEYEGNQEIESLIKNVFPQFKGTQKIYEISNGDVYRELMIEALETNKFKSSVTAHSAEDFSNMRLFVTEDGSTGITLTKDGFLGGAFGNPKAGRPNNLAQMMLLGIKEGALTAEAFDTVLPNYYSMFGFKAVSRTAFNEEYRPLKENGALEDWNYELYSKFNNGRPDVVFFIYDGGDRESIQDRVGQFDSYSNYQKDFTEYYDKDSYDDAYRFMEVEAINKSNYQNLEDAPRSSQLSTVTDLSGNQTEVDSSSIVTYESEAGPIHYIVDSSGDMQMVRLTETLNTENATEQELQQIKEQAIANGTFMKAPNGKDTNLNERQWLQVRSKAFKDWFGDWQNDPQNASKVVDENGEPLVVYHGSPHRFNTFDENISYYFSSSKDVANTYKHKKFFSEKTLYEVFLNIRNLEEVDGKGKDFNEIEVYSDKIQSEVLSLSTDEIVQTIRGIRFPKIIQENATPDGVMFKNIRDSILPNGSRKSNVYAAFNPNQIKSATGNVGTYSNESNDIRHQRLDKVAIKGAVTGSNEVFINTDLATPDTPIHEFAHLYNTWLQQNRPELWEKGKALVEAELGKENSEIQEVIDYVRITQPALSGDAFIEEIIAELVGRRGQALIESKSKTGLAGWLKEVWEEIAKMLGLSQMSAEQVSKLTIMEYADAMAVDLLSGRDLKKQKRFTVKPKVTPRDTKVNARGSQQTPNNYKDLFSSNRKYSRKDAPTITSSAISKYNVFMILEDKIKSIKLLSYDKQSNTGNVYVTFTDSSVPSSNYKNVSFNHFGQDVGISIPDGVTIEESPNYRSFNINPDRFENKEDVKKYFTNLVVNGDYIKFADETREYKYTKDGLMIGTQYVEGDMDFSRPFTVTKEKSRLSSVRRQSYVKLDSNLESKSRTEQRKDC